MRPSMLIGHLRLFFNCAAGDSCSGVTGWIGLHIVRLLVNHQSGATVGEQGVGSLAESDVGIHDGGLGGSFSGDSEVLHVTSVRPFGVLEAMVLLFGVEMASGGRKCGRLAGGVLMKVKRMFTWRQAMQI